MEKLNYYKMVYEGSSYEIGKKKGEFLKSVPILKEIYTSVPEGGTPLSAEEAYNNLEYFDQYCKGLKDELQGVADGMEVELKDLFYCLFRDTKAQACSQVSVLPAITADGHHYIGRSYEYNLEDEFMFNITRADGCYAHMGFSLSLGGRFDGMNEKGLCITMSSCECVASSCGQAEGLPFKYVIRAILDRCSTVKEAVELLEATPMCFNMNFMIADTLGECIVAEILTAGGKAKIAYRNESPYMYALNHYQSEEHLKEYSARKNFSKLRGDAIETFFSEHDKVSKDDLIALLTAKIPEGLCCHAYEDWFGTLRSMVFDVTASRLLICMGSPQNTPWMEVTLGETEGVTAYEVIFEEEAVPVSFWQETDER